MRRRSGRTVELEDGESPPPPFAILPGVARPVAVSEGGREHRFNDPFAAAVWLLDSFATAEQIQQLRGDLGRLLLTRVEVVEHPAPAWWGGQQQGEG